MTTREDWAPTIAGVGALLRARTRNTAGEEVGTFNEDTRPSDTQVEELINGAQQAVVQRVGSEDVPENWWFAAQQVATIRLAMAIELGYFPEQVNTGRSPYPQLKELFDEEIIGLVAGIESGVSGDGQTDSLEPVWVGLPNVPTPNGASWQGIQGYTPW